MQEAGPKCCSQAAARDQYREAAVTAADSAMAKPWQQARDAESHLHSLLLPLLARRR